MKLFAVAVHCPVEFEFWDSFCLGTLESLVLATSFVHDFHCSRDVIVCFKETLEGLHKQPKSRMSTK
jgi:hypothetical protein